MQAAKKCWPCFIHPEAFDLMYCCYVHIMSHCFWFSPALQLNDSS